MTQRNLIGVAGFIGSGKGTIGDYLVSRYNFKSESFAGTLKDAVSAIFGWDRHLLEGDTQLSREWREQPDIYWSRKMNKNVTPRWVIQHIGTDVMRFNFFDDIWVSCLEKKIQNVTTSIVITDVRFPNEIKMIRENGGSIWWAKRDKMPEWFNCAVNTPGQMPIMWKDVHPSEYMWLNCGTFVTVDNSGTLDDLYSNIDELMKYG